MAEQLARLGGEGEGQTTDARKVALASSIGAAIEWYDFFIYGTAAGLVFGKLFFTKQDPTTGLLAAYATFAVGYLARPFGSLIFGHLGDRIGRKAMLILTLLIMGLGTAVIGVLPTYSAIGIWAPILLLLMRVLQGIGVGGEYGGAVLMAVEYAPAGRRGFFGSWPQCGVPAGLLFASLVFSLLGGLPGGAFLAWGWRVAFLVSVVLVVIGVYIRLQVFETPAFQRVRQAHTQVRVPFLEMLRAQPRELVLSMGVRWIEGMTFNVYGVLAVSFIAGNLHLPRSTALNAIVIASAIGLVVTPLYGALSDRVGRKPVYLAGLVACTLAVFPAFLLMETRQTWLVYLAIIIPFGVFYYAIYSPLAAFWAELFDTRFRYTGVGSVYQFSGIYASGLTPLIGTLLIARGGGRPWLMAIYMVVVGIISLASVLRLPETFRRDILPAATTAPEPPADSGGTVPATG